MAKKHPVEDYGKWVFKSRFYVLTAVVTVIVIAAVCPASEREQRLENLADNKHEEGLSKPEGCDLFDGKWVYDNQSHPLYKEESCSFMALDFACERYGRKDLKYQNWRWQPHHCNLPRFNATEMLEGLRGKRLVFVGDSLNKNQFISMVCLVESVIPDPTLKTFYYHGSFVTFKALEYNAAIEFYWAPFLVESNNDNPFYHHAINRIVRVKSIEKHARLWTDADILVFNSFLWWRLPKMKLLWGSFNSSDPIYKEVEVPRSYEMALQTWSDWLEIHIDRTKTKLYFMSMSPTHEIAEDWGMSIGDTCYNETEMIAKEGYRGSGSWPTMIRAVEATLGQLRERGLNVQLINITQLSEYRKEAHPTIYRKIWHNLTEEEISDPRGHADCYHWCLPGVPDTWNVLLFAHIFRHSQHSH